MAKGRPSQPPKVDPDALAALAAEALGAAPPPPEEPQEVEDYGSWVERRRAANVRRAAIELRNRQTEALRLYTPTAPQLPFHRSTARQRIIRGSNRSGKTLAACVEVARCVTGQDPFGKYWPVGDGTERLCWLVGLDLMHAGRVFFKKLFRPGEIRMIWDDGLGRWRAFDPLDPKDAERKHETKPAPALIPKRFVKSVAWEDKAKGIPKLVTLTTGWELAFFSSMAPPPQGMPVDMCLAGWSEVYDPVLGRKRRVDEIDGPFHVLSACKKTGEVVVAEASRPFVKGIGTICEVRLSNGEVLHTTTDHRVLTADARWVSVRQAWEEGLSLASVAPSAAGCLAGATPAERSRATCRTSSPAGRCSEAGTRPEVRRPSTPAGGGPSTAQGCDDECVLHGTGTLRGCPERCGTCCRPGGEHRPPAEGSHRPAPQQQGGAHERTRSWSRAGDPGCTRACSRTHPSAACDPCPAPGEGRSGESGCPLPSDCGRSLPGHGEGRRQSPQGSCFGRRMPPEASRGQSEPHDRCPPADEPGCRPRQATDGPGRCSTAGGWRSHPAQGVPHSTCDGEFRAAASERQASAESSAGDDKTPLYVSSIIAVCEAEIWDINVREHHNYVYGGAVNHNCLFDEEVENEEWYPEATVRLASRGGFFIWSATPQAGTEQLLSLSEKAERDAERPDRLVEEFVILLSENPHIAEADKRMMAEMLTEDQARVRIDGEFAAHGLRVFPDFQTTLHVRPAVRPEPHWTRYAAVDPGRQVCAVLFAAVPPPGEQPFDVLLYDELYVRNSSAAKFGEAMKRKCQGQEFEAFLIDGHMGRQTEMGSGKTVERQYARALEEAGVKSRATGHGFRHGLDDVQAGIELVRGLLRVDGETGRPRLAVADNLPNFVREVKRYRYKRVGRVVTDEPESRGEVHLMATLRYLAGCGLKFKKRSGKARVDPVYAAFMAKQKRRASRDGQSHVTFGPAGGAA